VYKSRRMKCVAIEQKAKVCDEVQADFGWRIRKSVVVEDSLDLRMLSPQNTVN